MEQLAHEVKVLYVGSSGFVGLASEQSLYDLSTRTIELEVMPSLRAYGLGLIRWRPLGGGLLASVLRKADEGRRASEEVQRRVERLHDQLEAHEALCAELGEDPAAVALAWPLHNPAVTAPLTGPRAVAQLEEGLHALEIELPNDVLARLDGIWPGPGGEAPEAYAW